MKQNEMDTLVSKKTLIGINPNTIFLKTLRNSGYNNYTAIADIIDNSLDNEVNSTQVDIITKNFKNPELASISIADNGCGMNFDILNEALRLGSNTGKDAGVDLGCYGTGMKAAALSLGRKFELKTKSLNDKFYIIDFDIDEIEISQKWEIPCRIGSNEELLEFNKQINSETGTIITITKLDKINCDNITMFNDKLKKDLSLIYNIFIKERNIKINVNSEPLSGIDPMWRDLKSTLRLSDLNAKIKYKSKDYTYNAFYIDKTDSGDEKHNENDLNKIGRNSKNAGIYIYRNYRLVGSGLGLGIINKTGDSWLAGLRIELFVDGNDDYIFGSTFMKMIQEKNRGDVDQGFIDKCDREFTEYRITAKNLNRKDEKLTEDEGMKQRLNKAIENINTNPHIKPTIAGGKNEKNKESIQKIETKNIGRNKFSPRKREYGFCEYSLVSLGAGGSFVRFLKIGGKSHVEINVDHLFYQEFISKCDDNTLGIILRMLVSFNLAKNDTTWHNENEKNELFDEFFLKASELLRTMIKY